MAVTSVLTLILTILLIVILCYVVLLIVERVFGPIDPLIKSLVGAAMLILLILYVLQHLGVVGLR